jgi:hypothetical protein
MNRSFLLRSVTIAAALCASLTSSTRGYAAEEKTLTGEVVDLMCYVENGAKGDGHKGCAEKCIKGGGPVGLLSGDQVYLVVGDHKSLNDELAPHAAKTVTLKGKVSERSGMKMITDAKLQK